MTDQIKRNEDGEVDYIAMMRETMEGGILSPEADGM